MQHFSPLLIISLLYNLLSLLLHPLLILINTKQIHLPKHKHFLKQFLLTLLIHLYSFNRFLIKYLLILFKNPQSQPQKVLSIILIAHLISSSSRLSLLQEIGFKSFKIRSFRLLNMEFSSPLMLNLIIFEAKFHSFQKHFEPRNRLQIKLPFIINFDILFLHFLILQHL